MLLGAADGPLRGEGESHPWIQGQRSAVAVDGGARRAIGKCRCDTPSDTWPRGIRSYPSDRRRRTRRSGRRWGVLPARFPAPTSASLRPNFRGPSRECGTRCAPRSGRLISKEMVERLNLTVRSGGAATCGRPTGVAVGAVRQPEGESSHRRRPTERRPFFVRPLSGLPLVFRGREGASAEKTVDFDASLL